MGKIVVSENNSKLKRPSEAEIDAVKPVARGLSGKLLGGLGKLLIRLLTRFEIQGQENLPKNSPYILAPNHETYVDGLIAGMGLRGKQFDKLTCLAAKELETDHGIFGKIIMRVGRGIPLDRKGNPLTSLKICIKQLEEDNILMIHPEGTRSADGKLGKIQDGAAFIAKHSNALIVPTFIDGGYEIFSRHMSSPSFFEKPFRRRRLILKYGKPLDPKQYKNSKALTKDLSEILHQMYDDKEVPRVYEGENLEYIEKLEAKLSRLKNIDIDKED